MYLKGCVATLHGHLLIDTLMRPYVASCVAIVGLYYKLKAYFIINRCTTKEKRGVN